MRHDRQKKGKSDVVGQKSTNASIRRMRNFSKSECQMSDVKRLNCRVENDREDHYLLSLESYLSPNYSLNDDKSLIQTAMPSDTR